MKDFKKNHLYLDLPKDCKPKDFVIELLRHFGLHTGGIFSLTPCEDPLCCNPFHFQITASKRNTRTTWLQNLRDLIEEIDWSQLQEMGINAYLEMYNADSFFEEYPHLKIKKHDLVRAIVLKSLTLPIEKREYFWLGFNIISDKKFIRLLTKTLS